MIGEKVGVAGFLADTWWFGLTRRLSERNFRNLAALRAEQGFSAVQLVVGVPPEVGPENENAASLVGFPWSLDGDINREYLELARDRIEFLNKLGLIALVYGAWGHQIDWLGKHKMADWWLEIIGVLDYLNVIYCLCGESNLWVGSAGRLLPDKTTDVFVSKPKLSMLPPRIRNFLAAALYRLKKQLRKRKFEKRRDDWSFVLEKVAQKTEKPLLVHPTASETGYKAVSNSELLAANTAQTGHSASARNRLWQLPLALLTIERNSRGYINLEPWYEGIRGQFWAEDQLFAYWVSMLAGASSHCYGAHGIWNVGDGRFLAHWGKQTFDQAVALDTPRLMGLSHKQYLLRDLPGSSIFHQTEGNELITIGKRAGKRLIQFFPDTGRAVHVPAGKIWLPLEGSFTKELPSKGQVVVFCD